MPRTKYEHTLAWMYALEAAKGMDFKLERVERALELLGNPQRQFASVHVAGTNGKGSVAATVQAILGAAGYRVGLYTSPHLVRFTERIRIGDREIGEDDVVELAERTRRTTEGRIELTFFELVTVMAFVYFAAHRVDVAVVEVGLGGRLDATNVIDPLVSVITTIGLDHTEFLGETVAAVAAEKAGIIKRRRPVVIGRISGAAKEVIMRVAAAQEAPLIAFGDDFQIGNGRHGLTFTLGATVHTALEPQLRGAYQIENTATALATVAQLPPGFVVSETALRTGLAAVEWPGRYEQIAGEPLIILDGAHNLEGARALAVELRTVAQERPLHLLFAAMRDKPWAAMIEVLGALCCSATTTEVRPPRGVPASQLAAHWQRYCPTQAMSDPAVAWAHARSCAKRGEAVVVTGSLFLIGAVYPLCGRGWDVGERRERASDVP